MQFSKSLVSARQSWTINTELPSTRLATRCGTCSIDRCNCGWCCGCCELMLQMLPLVAAASSKEDLLGWLTARASCSRQLLLLPEGASVPMLLLPLSAADSTLPAPAPVSLPSSHWLMPASSSDVFRCKSSQFPKVSHCCRPPLAGSLGFMPAQSSVKGRLLINCCSLQGAPLLGGIRAQTTSYATYEALARTYVSGVRVLRTAKSRGQATGGEVRRRGSPEAPDRRSKWCLTVAVSMERASKAEVGQSAKLAGSLDNAIELTQGRSMRALAHRQQPYGK